jgi:small conductance mechanosensitive channel
MIGGAVLAATLTPEEIEACTEDGSTACLVVYRWTENELAARGVDWFVAKPLTIAVILLLAYVAVKLLTRAIARFMRGVESAASSSSPTAALRVKQRTETIGLVLRSVVRIVVAVIAITMILGELGISVGPLIAGAGIVGIALGFGAQTIVKDFLSGMFMLIEDQFGVGDVIDVGEATGSVEAVTLRTTRIRSVDGTLWHVPNGTIQRVGNKSQEWSRALIDVEVAYATDLDHAQEIIKRVADEMWQHDETLGKSILEAPEVWGVEQLGASGVVIRLVVKTLPADQWKVMRALRLKIKAAFDAEGIEIPFPQQTIWVRGNQQAPFQQDEPPATTE